MTTSDSLIIQGRLLGVLRGSDRPRSTDELAEVIPPKVERTRQGDCEWWCRTETPAGVRVLECHRSWHVVEYRRTAQGFAGIYRHLRALERRGLAQRCRIEGDRRVFWMCTGDAQRQGSGARLNSELATSSEGAE